MSLESPTLGNRARVGRMKAERPECASRHWVDDRRRIFDSMSADEIVLYHDLFGEWPRAKRMATLDIRAVEKVQAMRRLESTHEQGTTT